jgi:hemerythrin-like domain-containing protein
MTTALEILYSEHQHILKVVDVLTRECDGLDSGKDVDIDFFKEVIEFVRNYADKFHHAKEEDILFVEFNKDGVETHCNPVGQMLIEHDLGRNFIKELEIGVGEKNKEKIVENARGYAQLLQEHIFKEDSILYPMADEALNEEVKKEILDRFLEVEKTNLEDKEKFLEFVKDLKDRD